MKTDILSLTNIWVGYDKNPILQDINLVVHELDFLGIIGPNGGGKTTLIKLILGLLKPWQGQVEIMGRNVLKGREYIGYVPQIFEFDRNFPVRVEDVVLMGRLGKNRFFRWFNKKDDEKAQGDRHIAHSVLDQVGMLNCRHYSVSELSGGQRQRIYIARALASKPQILLLDEPTANVDPQSQNSIYELLKYLNQSVTIILVSHDIEGIANYIKTVACLNRRLLYHGDKFVSPKLLQQTYQSLTINHQLSM